MFRRILHALFGHSGVMQFVSNLFGDKINRHGGCRSVWSCSCGGRVHRNHLYRGKVGDKINVPNRLWHRIVGHSGPRVFQRNMAEMPHLTSDRSVWKCSCGDFVFSQKTHRGRKVFSFDAETNGLWGQAFCIGALVYDEFGTEVARFIGRCPIVGPVNDWVKERSLPELEKVPVTHSSYMELLADFAMFYMANKQDADMVVHMGYIVEAALLRDMWAAGFIGEWDGPYPLYDVSGNLQAAGEDATSVDKFVAKHGLQVGSFTGGTHNPLYDSAVTAAVYRRLVFDTVQA